MCFALTSCSMGDFIAYTEVNIVGAVFKTDRYIADTGLKDVLKSIETNDRDQLLSALAPNAINNCNDMEAHIDELFEYCSGKTLSYREFNGGPIVEESFDREGNIEKILYPTYDVKTNDGNYRITFKLVAIDTTNEDNEGIWSLYVIKSENDTDLNVAYRGDDKYTTGIQINVMNVIFDD